MNSLPYAPLYETAANLLGPEVFKGAKLLEVGCARFVESIAIKKMGTIVTAIDVLQREEPPAGINFIQSDFLKFNCSEQFDILYLSNAALFILNDKVMPKIKEFKPKYIMVKTMYDYPEPNWGPDELQTLYFTTLKDWVAYFEPLGYGTKHASQYEKQAVDMQGRSRLFRLTEYIGEMA